MPAIDTEALDAYHNDHRMGLSTTITGSEQLSHLLEAEAIAFGVQGKQARWESLQQVLEDDFDIDLPALADRARQQFDEVQDHRLAMARRALTAT